jgi:hypothetical protein
MIHPITVVIFLLVVFFAAGLAMLWLSEKASRWIRIRRVRVQLEKELSIEEARQAALPKLDTRYLIRMPDWAVLKYYGAEDHHPRKAFGTRYSNLIVFDEVGDVWLGLFMPATLQSLRDCEYSRGEYWVWFRGGGEAYSGTPLTLNGVQIWSYPVWMDPFDAHIDDRPELCSKEWRLWAELEHDHDEAFKRINPYDFFKQIWTAEEDHQIVASRQRLLELQTELKHLSR